MRALIATLVLTMTACAAADSDSQFPTKLRWQWSSEEGCTYPSRRHRDALDFGAGLWAEWGVDIARAQGSDIDVIVCLTPGMPRYGYAGWTDIRAGLPALVEVNSIIPPQVTPAVYAHELGHVIVYPESGHHAGVGILAPHVLTTLAWTPDDREYLAELGFVSR